MDEHCDSEKHIAVRVKTIHNYHPIAQVNSKSIPNGKGTTDVLLISRVVVTEDFRTSVNVSEDAGNP